MNTTLEKNTIPDTWDELINTLYNLRPVKTDKAYKTALNTLSIIIDISKPNADQKDYKAALSKLITEYESIHYPIEIEGDGIDALQFLADENGLSKSDIGRILGNRTLGCLILNRQRGLSKNHIKKLCEYFSVKPELFLR